MDTPSPHCTGRRRCGRSVVRVLRGAMMAAAALLSFAFACASASAASLPAPSSALHHLTLYTSPAQPPTQLSFLLLALPQATPVRLRREAEEDGDGGDAAPLYADLARLDGVHELGADFAEVRCGPDADAVAASTAVAGGSAGTGATDDDDDDEGVRMSLHNWALSDALPDGSAANDTDPNDLAATAASAAHISSFDHWLIGSEGQQRAAHQLPRHVRNTRRHAPMTFLMPQVRGHRETPLGAYVMSLPSVRRLLRSHPHSLLFLALVSSHLPYYVELNHMDAADFVAAPSAQTPKWRCEVELKEKRKQAAWPLTQLYVQRPARSRRPGAPPRFAPLTGVFPFAPQAAGSIPRSGVWIRVSARRPEDVVARELRLTVAEAAAAEVAAASRREFASSSRGSSDAGVVSLISLDAMLGIQGAAVKAVLDPVLKLLMESIADEGEHTTDQQVGSKVDTNTPSQVMELTLEPLKTLIKDGVGESVPASIMASLTGSMTEFLSTYVHDEVTHDAIPPLYLALTEILEKHVKDEIVKMVPPAVRKHVPVTLSNRLGRALIHAVPPALTQILKIAHSPATQYFCFRCFHRDSFEEDKQHSLFNRATKGSYGRPTTGRYEQKHYCELCHSSAERLYYHNYHATHYADYYADYYVPYYTQSLVEMEKTRSGRDNNEMNQPAAAG